MQVGFGLLEIAQVRSKNRRTVLNKNLLSICVSMCIFFAVGYGFGFGGHALGGAVGAESEYVGAFSADGSYHERKFVFYFSCVIIGSTIVNASVNEKAHLGAIIGFTILFQLAVLPICLSWGWGFGFLYRNDFEDHGGAISIYFCAATCALVANIMLGPRYGVFMDEEEKELIKGGGKKFRRK